MRLFQFLSDEEREQIFFKSPDPFSKYSPKETLAYTLGATLYMPATRKNIHQDLISKKHEGLTSIVICLEDAIGDSEVIDAEENLVFELTELYYAVQKKFISIEDIPLIFIRIRESEQMRRVITRSKDVLSILTGFVFPKFTTIAGREYLELLSETNQTYDVTLYGMPILETKEIIYKETRMQTLLNIQGLLDEFHDFVLNVRIGATDFCGLFGIRRSMDTTIYDIAVVRDCITDIINVFARNEKQYVISGPVWEYFSNKERILKPQLRQTPFKKTMGTDGLELRSEMINSYIDGLIREILLDLSNGLIGKTIIHPTHILPVQALNVVTLEEYLDAKTIIEAANEKNGVVKSHFSNKMNEIKPHYYWAEKIMKKSIIYGVFQDEHSFIDLLREPAYV